MLYRTGLYIIELEEENRAIIEFEQNYNILVI